MSIGTDFTVPDDKKIMYLAIYSRALTPNEISCVYNQLIETFEKNKYKINISNGVDNASVYVTLGNKTEEQEEML